MTDADATVMTLRKLMGAFVAERQWERFHDPKNLAASIAIEAAELMEHFQWLRNDELETVRADAQAMCAIREELADVVAYVLSFANALDIDIAGALEDKMAKNAMKYPADRFRGRFRTSRDV